MRYLLLLCLVCSIICLGFGEAFTTASPLSKVEPSMTLNVLKFREGNKVWMKYYLKNTKTPGVAILSLKNSLGEEVYNDFEPIWGKKGVLRFSLGDLKPGNYSLSVRYTAHVVTEDQDYYVGCYSEPVTFFIFGIGDKDVRH